MAFCINYACKKEKVANETFDEYGYFGATTADLNGLPWTAKTIVSKASKFDVCTEDSCLAIIADHYINNNINRGRIVMGFLSYKTGKAIFNKANPWLSKVKNSINYYSRGEDGDVLTGSYSIIKKDENNFINISKIDRVTGDFEATFEATMVRDSAWLPKNTVPDTIKIKNGKIRGRYWQK